MITTKHFAAALGFAFVAVWIGTNLGYAVLCLVGAAVFYLLAELIEGEIDLGELQARLSGRTQEGASSPPRARPRARVQ
jgi:hypothetical protein